MGAFDDLIPAKASGAFDDLVPQAAAPDVYHQAAADTYEKQKAAGLTGGQTEGLANRVLHGATMGFGDSILAGLETPIEMVTRGVGPSDGYKYAKAFQDVKGEHAKEDTGALGTAAEIGASFGPGGAIAKGVGKVIAKPVLQSVATGAAMGAGQAAGDGEDIGAGAIGGALGGAAGAAAGKVIGGVASKFAGRGEPVPVQTTDQIKNEAQNLYKRFEESGGAITQQGASDLHNTITRTMSEAGVGPGYSPKFDYVLKTLDKMAPSNGAPNLGTADIQHLRQTASTIAQSIEPSERRIGRQIIGAIDDFMGNASPEQFQGGMGAQHAADLLKEANSNWTRYSKADQIDQAMKRAEQSAQRTYSGGNVQNSIAQKVGALADKRRDWTPEELAALDKVSNGVPRVLRAFGKTAPDNGMSLLGNAAIGLGTGGATVPLSVAALLAKSLGNRMQRNNVSRLSELVRSNGAPSTVEVTPSAIEMWLQRNPTALAQGIVGTANAD